MTPAGPRPHIAALDGLRGVAALMVLASHLDRLGGGRAVNARTGDYGVLLFFVLSGFLMGYLYLDRPFDRAAVTRYAAARSARIVPLYGLVVLASFAASPLLGPGFVYFMGPVEFARLLAFCGHISVFWSIGPEVQFYILFVGIWYAAARGWFASLPFLTLAALGTTLLLLVQPLMPGMVLPSKLHVFLIGVATAVLLVRSGDAGHDARLFVIAQIAALTVLAAVAVLPGPVAAALNPSPLVGDRANSAMFGQFRVILPMAAILLAFTRPTRVSALLLANRPMRAVGTWSFSLYLLHLPVLALVGTLTEGAAPPGALRQAIGAVAAVAAAAISFALIERPCGRAVHRRWRALEEASPAGPRSTSVATY